MRLRCLLSFHKYDNTTARTIEDNLAIVKRACRYCSKKTMIISEEPGAFIVAKAIEISKREGRCHTNIQSPRVIYLKRT